MLRHLCPAAGIFSAWLAACALAVPAESGKGILSVSFDAPETLSALTVRRTAVAPVLPEVPKVDGLLSDEAWAQATQLEGFTCAGTADTAPVETRVLVGHCEGVLYIGVICMEPEAQRRNSAAAASANSPENGVEILLDGAHDRLNAYTIFIMPSGRAVSSHIVGEEWPVPWKSKTLVAVSRTEAGWNAEIAVPRSSLGESINDIIGFNVVRRRPGVPGEPYVWNPAPKAFENAAWFGNLCLETTPCTIEKVEVGWPHAGRNDFRVWLRTTSEQDQDLRVGIMTRRADKKVDRSAYKIAVPAGRVLTCEFSHRIGAPGLCDLFFVVTDGPTGKLITQFSRARLDVGAMPLTIDAAKLSSSAQGLAVPFRIALPLSDIAGLSLNAAFRVKDSFQTLDKAVQIKLLSRSGSISIHTAGLNLPAYQLEAWLSGEGQDFSRVVVPIPLNAAPAP